MHGDPYNHAPRVCEHPGCTKFVQTTDDPLSRFCAEHQRQEWRRWRVDQRARADVGGRNEAEIRADLAAQLKRVFTKWERRFSEWREESGPRV